MTRKSKRQIERDVTDLKDREGPDDPPFAAVELADGSYVTTDGEPLAGPHEATGWVVPYELWNQWEETPGWDL